MGSKIKVVGFVLLATVLLPAFVIAKWSLTPVRTDVSIPDPAVVYANKVGKGRNSFKESYFEHDGRRLHYVEAGRGETVIFLHGFPSYWYSFAQQMQGLKGQYHVVAIDGLGAGKSDAPLEIKAYRLENMAAHLEALIDHIGADKVHLVGHDWGSGLAFGFAQRYPQRVLTVTGISAPPQNVVLDLLQSDSNTRKMASYIERLKQANPALIVALGADKQVYEGAYRPLMAADKLTNAEGELFRNSTGDAKRINAHINWYRANIPAPAVIDEADFWPSRNAKITMPALLIWGEDDRVFADLTVDRMLRLSAELQLVPLKSIGHWPHVEQAEKITTVIRKHISAASGRHQAIDP